MNIVLDSNILVRFIVGRRAAIDAADAMSRGIRLNAPVAQIEESVRVLVRNFGFSDEEAMIELTGAVEALTILDEDVYSGAEMDARARFHRKAQVDWPVLAAAMATDAGIWTDDRDFFGVGVPVWSSVTIGYAAP
jgi:predicted nucleic acid-binding protein